MPAWIIHGGRAQETESTDGELDAYQRCPSHSCRGRQPNSIGDDTSFQWNCLSPVFIPLAHNFLSTVLLSLFMTEYDFSPEAVDAYVKKQHKIGRWVNDTKRHPPANPFTPATPAVHASEVNREESHGSERRYRRRTSHDKHHGMDMVRDMSPEGRAKHNRSASYSTTNTRPEPPRSRTMPQPLQLGPYQNNFMSSAHLPSPTSAYPHYPYAQKLTSPRDSKHSSRTSSSTWIQPANSYYPQTTPHSAPVYPRQPVRSQTIPPSYGYPMQHHVAHPNRSMGYLPVERILPPCANCADPNFCSSIQNAPQLPHSYYQSKRPPLLKRLFMGLTGSSKHKPPRRKRSMSF
jgi:hypothetical protein